MAVGKGSMERAAKAVNKTEAENVSKAETVKKQKPQKEKTIVYQKSSGMLERAAEPNERFGLGDAMPVYYF